MNRLVAVLLGIGLPLAVQAATPEEQISATREALTTLLGDIWNGPADKARVAGSRVLANARRDEAEARAVAYAFALTLLHHDQPRTAESLMAGVLRSHPQEPFLVITLVRSLLYQNKREEAAIALADSLANSTDEALVWSAGAMLAYYRHPERPGGAENTPPVSSLHRLDEALAKLTNEASRQTAAAADKQVREQFAKRLTIDDLLREKFGVEYSLAAMTTYRGQLAEQRDKRKLEIWALAMVRDGKLSLDGDLPVLQQLREQFGDPQVVQGELAARETEQKRLDEQIAMLDQRLALLSRRDAPEAWAHWNRVDAERKAIIRRLSNPPLPLDPDEERERLQAALAVPGKVTVGFANE